MDITVRRAEERDIPRITELLLQVHKVHSDTRPDLFRRGSKKYTEQELREILADDTRPVFVADRAGSVEGYAFCVVGETSGGSLVHIKTLYIDDLCVDENSRGGGIGSLLYHYVVDYAGTLGCYNVTLNVWAENTAARAFYDRMGLKVQKIGMEHIIGE